MCWRLNRLPGGEWFSSDASGGVAVETAPQTHTVMHSDAATMYAQRANRIVVRHHLGRILSVIEIVAPGNKASSSALHRFVRKTGDFLSKCVHVLVVDLFPPTPRDPNGIHQAIWDDIAGQPFALPPDKSRTLAS